MRRSWIGFFMLLVLLAGALGVTWGMEKIHRPIARELEQAAGRALAGDWESADALSVDAGVRWERWTHFRGCFADHTPMEEVDGVLAEVSVYRAAQEEADFAAACACAARKVAAMGQAHGLSWWNVL